MPLITVSGKIPKRIATAASMISGTVIVKGASTTSVISGGKRPKKMRFIVHRVYPAVSAVETTAPIATISFCSVRGCIAELMDPKKIKNSEMKPLVGGTPTIVRNPMRAAVAVIGIFLASPPSLDMLLVP
jgi:hypothetical protein